MSEAVLDDSDNESARVRNTWHRKSVVIPLAVLVMLLIALGAAWLSRERIAGDIVDSQLRANGLTATYEIGRVGGRRQIVRNLVIGDPARPDLTAERAEIHLAYRLGTPQIGRIVLVKPRLYGQLAGSRVSFGTLDRVLYRETGKPPGLPDTDLTIRDGRALIRTPHGPVGIKLDGAGRVSGGFSGSAALAMPALSAAGCQARNVSAFGRITTKAGEPSFEGPVRLERLACDGGTIRITRADTTLAVTADKTLAALRGRADVSTGPMTLGTLGSNGADLAVRGNWKNGLLDAQHVIALRGFASPQLGTALVTAEGDLRMTDGFRRIHVRSVVEARGMRPGGGFSRTLDKLSQAGEGSLIQPLVRRFAAALAAQARGSGLTADLTLRRTGGATSIVIPQAEVTGGGGERILSLSRVEARIGGGRTTRFSGNLATGGPDMPRISGRMEGDARGNAVFRLTMARYSAGESSVAVPQMSMVQGRDGALGFAGRVLASGPLPGGFASGLSAPVSGRWASDGALALWRNCVDLEFDRLQVAQLRLERRGVRLCPSSGRAIVERGRRGLRIAAGTPSLDLAGMLGSTPIRLASGPVGFAWPGTLAARDVNVALGPAETASRFTISNLLAELGGDAIAGTFAGADVRLARVPLDLREASGRWRYADGALALTEGDFRLVDRSSDARFEPLVARDGTLSLSGNIITAQAILRHPATDRAVTDVAITHNLGTARGHADLLVRGVQFDDRLQPEALTRRALGVVANARGTVTGTGRIDWAPDGVTSTGRFSTDNLDFAAAFGPVKGASGTVRFDDLIGLTTAPGQTIKVASVNPGIEVGDGEFTFQLRGGNLLAVEGGSWPFMGGRLTLRSVDLNFGVKELRRYVFAIEGLDAATFVERYELPNIAATGQFDGVVPIVFDENGNGRVENGRLTARAPGGNISYVGDLTYKDLSPMGNFAFDALRSLDYAQMEIAMNGSLTGEIVTNVRFDGVRQGAGAKRNVVTRALARLPIQFRINIRAPFYQLISSFKSLRDPAAVRDPRELGLLSPDGTRAVRREVTGDEVKPDITPSDLIPKQPPVQN